MKLKKYFSDRQLSTRLLIATVFFFSLFLVVTLVSYFLLPEGILKDKNPISDFRTSPDIITSTLQIFFYNLLSVAVIIIGSLFAFGNRNNSYISYGYMALGVQFTINAVTLGTWSFSAAKISAPVLSTRLLQTFDIFHRSGLWEMAGQLIVTCALARISFVRTYKKQVETKPIRSIRLTKSELIAIAVGLLLMFIGALIEGIAIVTES